MAGLGGAGFDATAGAAGAGAAGGAAGAAPGVAAGAAGIAAGVAGAGAAGAGAGAAGAAAGVDCIFFHSAAAKALSASLSASIGIVSGEPSAFLRVTVRAVMSTPVISASKEVPALLVHFRISAETRAGRLRAIRIVRRKQGRTFMMGTVGWGR